ncbi:TPA: hypothetical protein H1012_02205 [archaeon]|nr:hypothetical protein [Candidatus Naiadarchaeales archaeon SRR2090153.bin461]HIK02636.1 hypothetical protein [Candidatus Naiadarchaeales archaeon SRR2090159.bin1288]
MAVGQSLDIPIRDLVALHEKAEFPLSSFYLRFDNYNWLASFFTRCADYLVSKGKLPYSRAKVTTKWGENLQSLGAYINKSVPGREGTLKLRATLSDKGAVPLSVMWFLIKECKQNMDEVQAHIAEMKLGKINAPEKSPFFSIIKALHNSEKALAPFQLERQTGLSKIDRNMRSLEESGYLSRFGPKGAPFYTLRGEEEKFKKA